MPDSPKRRLRVIKPGQLVKQQARRRIGVPVTEGRLRQLFNEARIVERASQGELTIRVLSDNHPSPPLADEPICTQSQLLAYYGPDGKKIAEAHQYLRTDMTIGASGRPDPKEMNHQGTLYYLENR